MAKKKTALARGQIANEVEVLYAPYPKEDDKTKIITWIKMDEGKMCLGGPRLIFENEDDMRRVVKNSVKEYVVDPIISFTKEKPGLITTVNGISPF